MPLTPKETVATIRNRVIDQLFAIDDADYLFKLSQMIHQARPESGRVTLSEDQKLMLAMSEDDIAAGRIIDQQVLHERDLQWLKRR
jgi:hypothetical protein